MLIINIVPQKYYRIVIMTEWVFLLYHLKTSPSAYLFQTPLQENLAKFYRHRLDSLSKEYCWMLLYVMRTPKIHSLRAIQVSKLLMH